MVPGERDPLPRCAELIRCRGTCRGVCSGTSVQPQSQASDLTGSSNSTKIVLFLPSFFK